MKHLNWIGKFKWILTLCFLFLIASNSFADQCAGVSKELAGRVVKEFLKEGITIYGFCEPCRQTSPESITIKSVYVVPSGFSDNSYSIKINGEIIDLAYTYVPDSKGNFVNLAKLVDCPATGVSTNLPVSEAVPYVVEKENLKTPHVYVEPSLVLYNSKVAIVNPGTHNAYPLPDLSPGINLKFKIYVVGGANNDIKFWFLDMENYIWYSKRTKFAYYRNASGVIRNEGSFNFQIPKHGNYYLVLDNTDSVVSSKRISLYISALYPEPQEAHKKQQKSLEEFYFLLKKIFIFPDFNISIKNCGVENAFSDPNITICNEYVDKLIDQGLTEAGLWVLFHELGHSLLYLWDYPSFDNEDLADEFATIFLVMANANEPVLQAIRKFYLQHSEEEAKYKLMHDDRHSLSIQRARNIVNWLNNSSDLLKRWQKILVPNFQTEILQSMMNDPAPWSDRDLISKELQMRKQNRN